MEHSSLRSWVSFCQVTTTVVVTWQKLTTTKMWHFSYLKQNNHRNQRLLLNLVTDNNWVYLSKHSRYNWRFKFQFPHSTSTTLATYQKWPLFCLHVFYTETYKIRENNLFVDYHFWSMLFTKIGFECGSWIQILNGIYPLLLSTAALLENCQKSHNLGQNRV